MSPALTGLLGIDEVCKSCMAKLDTGALKCSKCQHFIHMSCSGLPEYQMVRFAVSQAQYMCMSCCKIDTGDQKYEEELKSIKDLLDREKLLITPPESDLEKSSDLVEQLDPVVPFASLLGDVNVVKNTEQHQAEIKNAKQTGKLCKFYAYRKCKYGSKGDKCPFEHRRKCAKFIAHGDKNNRGCKKGKNCDFYHPPMCHTSLRDGTCNRNMCKFQHVKGTRFTAELNYQGHDDTLTATNGLYPQTPRPRRTDNTYAPRILKRGETLSYSSALSHPNNIFRNDNPQSQNFMEVRHEIQQMRDQIQQISLQMKASPLALKTCQCRDQQSH